MRIHRLCSVLLLALFSTLMIACAPEKTVETHDVKLAKGVPVLRGFTFDQDTPARSDEALRYYDYTFLSTEWMVLDKANFALKEVVEAAGWELTEDVQSDLNHRITRWVRSLEGSQKDRMQVTLVDSKQAGNSRLFKLRYEINSFGK